MPLSWSEIRDKAIAFSREWQDSESERTEAQTFWNEFFDVFGVRYASRLNAGTSSARRG